MDTAVPALQRELAEDHLIDVNKGMGKDGKLRGRALDVVMNAHRPILSLKEEVP